MTRNCDKSYFCFVNFAVSARCVRLCGRCCCHCWRINATNTIFKYTKHTHSFVLKTVFFSTSSNKSNFSPFRSIRSASSLVLACIHWESCSIDVQPAQCSVLTLTHICISWIMWSHDLTRTQQYARYGVPNTMIYLRSAIELKPYKITKAVGSWMNIRSQIAVVCICINVYISSPKCYTFLCSFFSVWWLRWWC